MANGRLPPERESFTSPAPDDAPKIGNWFSLLLAGIVGFVVFAGLFVLMLQVGGPLAVAAVLVFGIGGVIALFHYVVWGWWLAGTIRREVEAEERQRDQRAK